MGLYEPLHYRLSILELLLSLHILCVFDHCVLDIEHHNLKLKLGMGGVQGQGEGSG